MKSHNTLVIAGAIIAAGMSRRLGTPKQLLPVHGKPVLQYIIEALREANLSRRGLVLGHAAQDIAEACDLTGVECIQNPVYVQGQGTSVAAAARYFSPDVDALIILLSDQPTVSTAVINQLVDAYAKNRDSILQPRYAEGPGNPVLISKEHFQFLMNLSGDEGARSLLKSPKVSVSRVNVASYPRPPDIDSWVDYRRVAEGMGDLSIATMDPPLDF